MFLAVIAFSFLACFDRADPNAANSPTSPSGPSESEVQTVALRLPVASLEVGGDADASATPLDNAGQPITSETVSWSSSDTSILVVSNKGVISARKMGSANVWATCRGKSGRGTLTVTDTLPAKVVVSPATASAAVGAVVQLTASVATRTGRALPGHAIRWTSADSHYAVVSPTGVVTGKSKGSVKVIAMASQVGDTAVVDIASASIATLAVSPGASTIASGSTVQLSAHAADADGNSLTGRSVAWESSNDDVATVSTSGLVTGLKAGSTTITATAEGVSSRATITVTAGDVKTITIAPGSIGLVAGGTQQLSATLSDAAGNGLPAASVQWSSADDAIASISSAGMVTAHSPGATTITAEVDGIRGRAAVAVSAGAVKNVSVTPSSLSLTTGGTRQLSATLTDGSGNTLSGQPVAWSSSDANIATVSDDGLVSAKHSGSATITAAAGGASDNAALTVTAGSVSSVSVTPGSASLVAGATQALVAKLTDNTGSTVTGQTVTWTSSDPSIVNVSSSGVATAAHVGNATVTATAGGQSGQAAFAVTAGPVASISVTPPSGTVQAGKTLQLAATYADVAGNPVPARSIAWTSSASNAATVSSAGLVTGVDAGTATITATADGKSDNAAITVTAADKPTLSSLSITPTTVSLLGGATQRFSVSGTWSDGSSTAPAVTFAATGGTITSAGVYTAGSTAGRYHVVATQQGGSKADSADITVTEPAPVAPTLTKLTISPGTASLSPNGTAQFTASGSWSDGSSTAPAVTFTASGGTISTNGLYTAGSTAGSYRVIATQQGHSMADTAAITITGAVLATSCQQYPHSRVVSVSTSSQLKSALASASPGDLIVMADGTYGGSGFDITVAGTQSSPITLCGSSNAIINTGSNTSNSGIEISGANYWTVSGITITNALFGIWGQKSSHFTIENMTFHAIGQEAVEIFNFSKYLTVRGTKFYDLGTSIAEYGEAIYIGSAYQKWSQFTGGQPDRSDSALVENNTFGPNVRAEMVEGKEGTTGGEIRNNSFDGTGMIESEAGWPSSWVMIEGNGYHVDGNRGVNTIISGYRVTAVYAGNGMGNIFSGNSADVRGANYGFAFDTPASNGNVAKCDNVVTNAKLGFGNRSCQ